MKTEPAYVASKDVEFLYPHAGDASPPPGAKVLLLTKGGVCAIGSFRPGEDLGWHPLLSRNLTKESQK